MHANDLKKGLEDGTFKIEKGKLVQVKKQKRSKYGNQRVVVDEISFDSKWESECYGRLKLLKKAGDIISFEHHVYLNLPGKVRYEADFMVYHYDGVIEVVDAKSAGTKTQTWINKWKQLKELYPNLKYSVWER